MLWRAITCIDPVRNDSSWNELKSLCAKNLSKSVNESFVGYYDRNRHYWSLRNAPRNAFIGRSFANSITESANSLVKHQGVCDAKSTLRVIYIAIATFDEEVINPDLMRDPPVVTPKSEKALPDRRQLLRSLQDVSSPIAWKYVPDQLSHLTLSTLIDAFKESGKYSSKKYSEKCFHVERQGREERPVSVVKQTEEGKLVCMSCRYINLFASPCSHVLTVAKIFHPDEKFLPFLERSFINSSARFDTLHSLYSVLDADIPITPLDDELLGLNEILQSDESSSIPQDEHDELYAAEDDVENVDLTNNNNHNINSREGTIAIKEREALQNGRTAQKARKWLLENVLLPRQRDAMYFKDKFQYFYFNCMQLLDQYETTAHKIFSDSPKKQSAIRRIGYYQNSQPTGWTGGKIDSSQNAPSKVSKKRKAIHQTGKSSSTSREAGKKSSASNRKRNRLEEGQSFEDGTYCVEEFRDFDCKSLKIVVKWQGHPTCTWERACTIIEDLGDAFQYVWDTYVDDLTMEQFLKADKAIKKLTCKSVKRDQSSSS